MSEQNNGGPAFPKAYNTHYTEDRGMNLRDYFAAKAMQGFAAHLNGASKRDNETGPQANARLAYEYADQMLKARG